MKRKYILMLVSILFIGISLSAQTSIQVSGIWKLSPVKILTLNTDQSFSYKKGANQFEGTYDIISVNGEKELIMHFENETISYIIVKYNNDLLELLEFKTGKSLKARLIESFFVPEEESDKKEVLVEENIITENSDSELQMEELPYKDYSTIIFSIYGGVSLTKASHQNLESLSFSFAGASNKTEYKSSLGYQFGVGLGYKIIDGFYIGTGVSTSKIGFVKYEEVTNDVDVDTDDALVFLESRYSIIGIHIPVTADIFAYKDFRIRGKLFASHFLSVTSQISVNAEASYFNNELQENLSFLSENEIVKIPNDASSLSYGYGLELQYYFSKSLGLGASYTNYNRYLSHDQRDINNRSLELNLLLSF